MPDARTHSRHSSELFGRINPVHDLRDEIKVSTVLACFGPPPFSRAQAVYVPLISEREGERLNIFLRHVTVHKRGIG